MIYLHASFYQVRRIILITLKDVARLAECHPATVSRALNNVSYVKPETKAKIMAAVEALGYRPDVVAKGLKKGKRYTIGVIVPNVHMTIFDDIIQSIETEARKAGYYIVFCHTNDDPEVEFQCLNRLSSGFVDGLIIASTGQNMNLIHDIHKKGLAVVQIIRDQDEEINSIVSDYERGSYDAVKYLYDKGCREIGLINGPSYGKHTNKPYRTRHEGYRRAVNELGLREICAFTDGIINNFESGYNCAKKLLDENPRLDAIMTSVDIHGMAALKILRERNINVPEQIKIISLTGFSIGNFLEKSLTSFELPAKEIGRTAAKLVIQEIENKNSQVQRLIFNAALSERESS